MISPTDTAYRLLPTSPSARELMDAYTPGLFELKFAEERTGQAAPRVGLLVLLKTFQQLGHFVKVADVPDSVLRQVAEAAGYDVVPQELDDYDRGTLRVRHMALVRSWMGVPAFDREALRIIVKACVLISRPARKTQPELGRSKPRMSRIVVVCAILVKIDAIEYHIFSRERPP